MSSKETRTLYDWTNSPEWANFAATDEDDQQCFYECEPQRMHGLYWLATEGRELYFDAYQPISVNWFDSLEKRPGT